MLYEKVINFKHLQYWKCCPGKVTVWNTSETKKKCLSLISNFLKNVFVYIHFKDDNLATDSARRKLPEHLKSAIQGKMVCTPVFSKCQGRSAKFFLCVLASNQKISTGSTKYVNVVASWTLTSKWLQEKKTLYDTEEQNASKLTVAMKNSYYCWLTNERSSLSWH